MYATEELGLESYKLKFEIYTEVIRKVLEDYLGLDTENYKGRKAIPLNEIIDKTASILITARVQIEFINQPRLITILLGLVEDYLENLKDAKILRNEEWTRRVKEDFLNRLGILFALDRGSYSDRFVRFNEYDKKFHTLNDSKSNTFEVLERRLKNIIYASTNVVKSNELRKRIFEEPHLILIPLAVITGIPLSELTSRLLDIEFRVLVEKHDIFEKIYGCSGCVLQNSNTTNITTMVLPSDILNYEVGLDILRHEIGHVVFEKMTQISRGLKGDLDRALLEIGNELFSNVLVLRNLDPRKIKDIAMLFDLHYEDIISTFGDLISIAEYNFDFDSFFKEFIEGRTQYIDSFFTKNFNLRTRYLLAFMNLKPKNLGLGIYTNLFFDSKYIFYIQEVKKFHDYTVQYGHYSDWEMAFTLSDQFKKFSKGEELLQIVIAGRFFLINIKGKIIHGHYFSPVLLKKDNAPKEIELIYIATKLKEEIEIRKEHFRNFREDDIKNEMQEISRMEEYWKAFCKKYNLERLNLEEIYQRKERVYKES